MGKYTQLAPLPAPGDINGGLTAVSQATMLHLLGRPGPLSVNGAKPSPSLALRLVTVTLPGGLRVTGLDVACRSLRAIFGEVQTALPDLLPLLGTEGMFCCRAVRGSTTRYSNHSWGCAIDLKVGGILTPQRATSVTKGLLAVYPYFHAHGWYWGAEFPVSDAMHFELAHETVLDLLGG